LIGDTHRYTLKNTKVKSKSPTFSAESQADF